MTHIDLFSGIGGFAYAAQQIWPDYRNLFFCDNNTFCQAVLRKNFGKDILIYDDIREVNIERVIADTTGNAGNCGCELESNGRQNETEQVGLGHFRADLLTGGFPCQPFSVAGKRGGRDDDRHLWPEMFRVIKAFRPRWVIGENVRGLINIENGMALEQVFIDLESIGYAVQAFVIPACAVNAPHRRDRVWIVGNANGSSIGEIGSVWQGKGADSAGGVQSDRHAANASNEGLERGKREQPIRLLGQPDRSGGNERPNWHENWLEVATRLCRVGDGLPAGLHGLKLSKSKHREERLKGLGNAIVPQVAVEIMKAIRDTE